MQKLGRGMIWPVVAACVGRLAGGCVRVRTAFSWLALGPAHAQLPACAPSSLTLNRLLHSLPPPCSAARSALAAQPPRARPRGPDTGVWHGGGVWCVVVGGWMHTRLVRMHGDRKPGVLPCSLAWLGPPPACVVAMPSRLEPTRSPRLLNADGAVAAAGGCQGAAPHGAPGRGREPLQSAGRQGPPPCPLSPATLCSSSAVVLVDRCPSM